MLVAVMWKYDMNQFLYFKIIWLFTEQTDVCFDISLSSCLFFHFFFSDCIWEQSRCSDCSNWLWLSWNNKHKAGSMQGCTSLVCLMLSISKNNGIIWCHDKQMKTNFPTDMNCGDLCNWGVTVGQMWHYCYSNEKVTGPRPAVYIL